MHPRRCLSLHQKRVPWKREGIKFQRMPGNTDGSSRRNPSKWCVVVYHISAKKIWFGEEMDKVASGMNFNQCEWLWSKNQVIACWTSAGIAGQFTEVSHFGLHSRLLRTGLSMPNQSGAEACGLIYGTWLCIEQYMPTLYLTSSPCSHLEMMKLAH